MIDEQSIQFRSKFDCAFFINLDQFKQGQIISLTGLLARVSLKQLKIEFYWLMLPAVIGIYMFTKTIKDMSC